MTISLKKATDLASFLSLEYQERYARNPQYSHRAFARDLSLSSSHLSDVLRGRRGLSRPAAETVSETLKLKPSETELLWSLVEIQFARTPDKKKNAKERIKTLRERVRSKKIPIDDFSSVSTWYHLAILEMAQLKDFKFEENFIARWLGIRVEEAKAAISQLIAKGLAEKNGDQLQVPDLMCVGEEMPSEAIRKFHGDVIDKAKKNRSKRKTFRSACSRLTSSRSIAPIFRARAPQFRILSRPS